MLLPTSPAYLRLQAARGARGGVVSAGAHAGYAALADDVDRLAAWLVRHGVGAGTAVGVLAANQPALVHAFFAVWGVGATVVPLGVRATPAETARLLEHGRVALLLADAARVDLARDAGAAAGVGVWALDATPPRLVRRARAPRARPARAPRPDDVATLAYTSGTTGAPKGVLLTHANLFWSMLACGQARGDVADVVGICLSPLTHVPVLVSHLLCRILVGGTAVLLERFDVDALLETVERHAVTDVPLIGGMPFDVLARGELPAGAIRSVRKISIGGAPTPMETKRSLARLFARAELIEAYGQTESTDGVTMTRGTSVLDRPGTVGRTNPHVVVAVRRPDGTLAAPEEEGEIVVGGPTVMRGYYRDAAATAATVRDGWLHTGDLGRQDADGHLYVTGRVKDLIITGGENVSAVEVEEALRAHPDVADIAVIGTPHPKWGEQVTAVVVPRNGIALTREVLDAFARDRLAGFKRPRRIEFVDALPRNAANKVQAGLLRARFGA